MNSGNGDSEPSDGLKSESKTLLVTGGAGYIGSHTVLELLNKDYEVVVVDNCANAFKEEGTNMPESLRRIQKMTGKQITFYILDLCNRSLLQKVFQKVYPLPGMNFTS
ncbi:UDP-glucose 4-epimerase-like [Convolutriloba macropyga]|uniref:UDP-glucose 4-epimerase-like n=1 Tax=Convolutriloba macropyga TaxID=536237 RepID=UPI003F525547